MTTFKDDGLKEGKIKNKHSIRPFKLNDAMYNALLEQKVIYDNFQEKFNFCFPEGCPDHKKEKSFA